MKTLDGKTAIVTGGGTGIGRSAALMLAAEGARVAVVGRRKAPLEQVVAEIEREKGTAVARTCDLTRSAEARALGAWAVQTLGGVDILINNAGQSSHARSIRWVSQDEWDSVINVNLTGAYALTQTVLPSMIERGAGTVVTVASLAATRPGGLGGVAYSAAKAGARAMMQAMHAELRNKGIRSCTIIPAEVDTPILDKRPLVPDAQARSTMMQADDVARAILLVCTMPQRTVIEEIVMSPTFQRDTSRDVAAGWAAGAPPGAK
ncbi:MAG TPA: SDR family oxidoreductase [Methylomirabilota bacterium]|nr:SDR family oxidoreductase [Methylomirabilota bacterium]